MKVVAYYRVSTQKQGLGLEAQRSIVSAWAKQRGAEIVAEYSEKESGKNDDRQALADARQECERLGAVLVAAKLDRISRNMLFIVRMFDEMTKGGLSFAVCDLPEMSPLTLGLFAGLAQKERELISERTKAALAVLKEKGVKLGNPNGFADSAREKGVAVRKENARSDENNSRAYRIAKRLKEEGKGAQFIAKELNEMGLPTRRGSRWQCVSVERLLKLFDNE